jgi:hypothetical protein
MVHIIHLAVEESLEELEDKTSNVCKAIDSSLIRMIAFKEKSSMTNTKFKKPLTDCPTK